MEAAPHNPQPAATPAAIVERGRVHVGWFQRPFERANLIDAPIAHALSGLRGGPLAALERRFRRWRLKEWHYTSVVDENVFFACAVVQAGYVGTAFAYVVDRKTGRRFEYDTLRPLGAGVTVADNSLAGRTAIAQSGWGRIVLDNDTGLGRPGKRVVEVHLEGRLGARPAPPLNARFEIEDPGEKPDPIVVVEESSPGRWLYTHKCYALKATGHLRAGEIEATVADGHAGLDFNRGFRPLETYWNWAAGGGYDRAGNRVGFNLTAHRPWHADESTEEDAADCALWLGERCVKLPRVEFDYDPSDMMAPWFITDDAGRVDLRFTPMGERREDIDFKLVVSRFHQPYGIFQGTLTDDEGTTHELADVFGVTEQHYARW